MEGGELFDRIQKKGHFTERGMIIINNLYNLYSLVYKQRQQKLFVLYV